MLPRASVVYVENAAAADDDGDEDDTRAAAAAAARRDAVRKRKDDEEVANKTIRLYYVKSTPEGRIQDCSRKEKVRKAQ